MGGEQEQIEGKELRSPELMGEGGKACEKEFSGVRGREGVACRRGGTDDPGWIPLMGEVSGANSWAPRGETARRKSESPSSPYGQ